MNGEYGRLVILKKVVGIDHGVSNLIPGSSRPAPVLCISMVVESTRQNDCDRSGYVSYLTTYVVHLRPAGSLAQPLGRKLSSSIVTCLSLCLRECSECLLVLVTIFVVTVN